MRITSIILSPLAAFALIAGMFAYWIGSVVICIDACPSVSLAGQPLLRVVGVTLGPGQLLALAACIVSLLVLRAQDRSTTFLVALMAPFIVFAVAALVLYIVGGSLTPVAAAGWESVAPPDRQVSPDWINATRYAVMPIVIWPLVSLIALLLSPAQRRS